MWKILFDQETKSFKKIVVPDVPLKDGFIRFRPKYYSVCGSDKSIVSGHRRLEHPVVIGHELSGYVSIGSGYDMEGEVINNGDLITILPNYYCGECLNCIHGNYNTCLNKTIIGVIEDGGLSEYLDLKPKFALKLPKSIKEELGALIEPTAVGVHALKKFSSTENPLIIIGAGGTGALAYETAFKMGFEDVSLVEINEKKIQTLKNIGIDTYKTIKEAIASKTDSLNILDTVGMDSLSSRFSSIFNSVASGSKIVITGLFSSEYSISSDLLIRKEIDVTGSIIYNPNDFILAKKIILKNQNSYLKFITNIIDMTSLKDLNDLYQIILDEKSIKNVVKLY